MNTPALFLITAITTAPLLSAVTIKLTKTIGNQIILHELLQENTIIDSLKKTSKKQFSDQEQVLLKHYFSKRISQLITPTSINSAEFNCEEKSIKNLQAKCIFYQLLVPYADKIFTQNHKLIKKIFAKVNEGPTKWLCRLLYHKITGNTIDKFDFAKTLNAEIQSSITDLELILVTPSKLQAFFSKASVILEPYYYLIKKKELKTLCLYNNQFPNIDLTVFNKPPLIDPANNRSRNSHNLDQIRRVSCKIYIK